MLPFPYGTGAGYIFSAALLKFVAASAEVTRWVVEASGSTREELQWQKYEDTTTGYWLTYCPHRIQFIDIGPQVGRHQKLRMRVSAQAAQSMAE